MTQHKDLSYLYLAGYETRHGTDKSNTSTGVTDRAFAKTPVQELQNDACIELLFAQPLYGLCKSALSVTKCKVRLPKSHLVSSPKLEADLFPHGKGKTSACPRTE